MENHLHPCSSSLDISTPKGSMVRLDWTFLPPVRSGLTALFSWPETLTGGPTFLGQLQQVPLILQVYLDRLPCSLLFSYQPVGSRE